MGGLAQAIVTLCAVYDEAAEAGEPYPTEAEIRSYNLLLIMGTHGKYAHNNAAFTSCLLVSAAPSPCPASFTAGPAAWKLVKFSVLPFVPHCLFSVSSWVNVLDNTWW